MRDGVIIEANRLAQALLHVDGAGDGRDRGVVGLALASFTDIEGEALVWRPEPTTGLDPFSGSFVARVGIDVPNPLSAADGRVVEVATRVLALTSPTAEFSTEESAVVVVVVVRAIGHDYRTRWIARQRGTSSSRRRDVCGQGCQQGSGRGCRRTLIGDRFIT